MASNKTSTSRVELTAKMLTVAARIAPALARYMAGKVAAEDALTRAVNDREKLKVICVNHSINLMEASAAVSHVRDRSLREAKYGQYVTELNVIETSKVPNEKRKSAAVILSTIKRVVRENPKQGLKWARGDYSTTYAAARDAVRAKGNKVSNKPSAIADRMIARLGLRDNPARIRQIAMAMETIAAGLENDARAAKKVVIKVRPTAKR